MKKQNDNSELFKELEVIFRNGEEISDYVFALVGLWTASLNYDYYITEYFIAESCDPNDWDPEVISNKRNTFVKNELRDLSEEIQKLKSTLERYHVNTNPRNINNAIQTIWKDNHSYFENLTGWKNNKSFSERTAIISLHFENVGLDEMLYYLSFIYLDLLKVREFLLSKLENSDFKSRQKQKKENLNNFGFKGQAETLKKFYQKWRFEILHDNCTEHDFVDVFMKDWSSHPKEIQFRIKNAEAAILIDMFDSYFDTISLRKAIEKSKKVLSSNGTHFTASSFSSALNKISVDKAEEIKLKMEQKYFQ